MSYVDLYMGGGPLLAGPGSGDAAAVVFGVPFDSTHSYRPGTRFGPDAIREAFNNIEVFHPGLRADLEEVRIDDLGNAKHTVSPDVMVEMVGRITAELAGGGRQVIILGGEHSITYGSYPAFPAGTGYVVFDAHYDLRDSYADARLSHASYLRRIIEDRGADGIVHVGARAFAREEAEFLAQNKITCITDAEIRAGRGPALLQDAASVFGGVYTSYDLDVLDPAFAPGVGNPEAAGITSRELLDMVGALGSSKVLGADIVELNPLFDSGATAALAARIMSMTIAANL
ncbi:arginase/agmatinase/formimionoglutamate hydrolase [Cenarchaeum symbiosum A]|uniref:Arginase/agmatinase/formimionoglutamate hydrolase n=1 Tax=Cenarchaeum symbiosum (strain A) TaxID=414004 RepID=A0RXD6_CENSY|nr:arginase/agmatinase/formimionoglutamate hydrolase [Cenarchaeum symbiosum A]